MRSKGIISRDFWWVDSKSIGQAVPALIASNHVRAQTHHESPGLRPGNPCWGMGVIRSFPFERANWRNSSVTTQQTVWEPRSLGSVLHFPSRYHPVIGSHEHVSNGPPSTLRLSSMYWACSHQTSSLAFRMMENLFCGNIIITHKPHSWEQESSLGSKSKSDTRV